MSTHNSFKKLLFPWVIIFHWNFIRKISVDTPEPEKDNPCIVRLIVNIQEQYYTTHISHYNKQYSNFFFIIKF